MGEDAEWTLERTPGWRQTLPQAVGMARAEGRLGLRPLHPISCLESREPGQARPLPGSQAGEWALKHPRRAHP